MIEVLPRLSKYYYARKARITPPLPLSLTLGLTYDCNSRCKTCRVYERKNGKTLSPTEWELIFKNLGDSPYWVTFTGGEPFLNQDIIEIYYYLVSNCKPAIVNIPTNGLLSDRIESSVWQMAKLRQETTLVINVSLDHYLPLANDEIRGVKGDYLKATDTLKRLQGLKCKNLEVGIHTVVSKYNVEELPAISRELKKLLKEPNNYITEIAENRVELKNTELDITPTATEYGNAIECLNQVDGNNHSQLSKIKRAFRARYYENVTRYLASGNHNVACYAGYTSCQITPEGEVWFCCMKADSIGNLVNVDYDLKRLWESDLANKKRNLYRHCRCPMANVSYTNMMLDTRCIAYIIREIAK